MNELSLKKISTKISTKRLTKYLINKFSIINGAKYSLGIFQNYSVFIPAQNILNILVALLRLNEMSKESIENITKSESNFAPTFVDHHLLLDLNFNGHCLRKNNISIPKKVINLYISYTLTPW